MVKINSPLMSMEASGKIGQRLVFSKRASGQQARFQKKQKDVFSLPRCINRTLYEIACVNWNSLPAEVKADYNLRAKDLKMTGFNLFLKEALADPRDLLGLFAFWSFNEQKGDALVDSGPNSFGGLLGPEYPVNAPTRVQNFKKGGGKALSFNYLDQYALISALDYTWSSSEITISCWFKLPELSTGRDSFYILSFENGTSLSLRYDNAFNPYFSVFNGSQVKTISFDFVAQKNVVYNLVATKRAENLYLYINGKLVAGPVPARGGVDISTSEWFIGNDGNHNEGFSGYIKDLIVFDRGYTDAEILDLYVKTLKN